MISFASFTEKIYQIYLCIEVDMQVTKIRVQKCPTNKGRERKRERGDGQTD
jgi:hypothetical protein